MICPSCGRDNPPASNFCLDCGTPLSSACSRCGNELPAGSRFCNACGTPVDQPSQAAPVDVPAAQAATEARARPHPTSFANGRYQVKQSLGEGGKKKVYLAHDTLLDREVAFALIKTEGLDETSRTRIQREAQANLIQGVVKQAQVCHQVFYFSALVEADASNQPVLHPVVQAGLL